MDQMQPFNDANDLVSTWTIVCNKCSPVMLLKISDNACFASTFHLQNATQFNNPTLL